MSDYDDLHLVELQALNEGISQDGALRVRPQDNAPSGHRGISVAAASLMFWILAATFGLTATVLLHHYALAGRAQSSARWILATGTVAHGLLFLSLGALLGSKELLVADSEERTIVLGTTPWLKRVAAIVLVVAIALEILLAIVARDSTVRLVAVVLGAMASGLLVVSGSRLARLLPFLGVVARRFMSAAIYVSECVASASLVCLTGIVLLLQAILAVIAQPIMLLRPLAPETTA